MRALATLLLALLVVSTGAAANSPYALDNPAQLRAANDRALLVAERGARNRILRVDSASGAFTVFATGILRPSRSPVPRTGPCCVELWRIAPDGTRTAILLHPAS